MPVRALLCAVVFCGLLPVELRAQFGQPSAALARSSTELAAAIAQKGFHRVGVFPQCVGRQAGGSAEAFSGATAPHGKLFAEKLQELLVERSAGHFEVIGTRIMAKACEGLGGGDLGDLAKLGEMAGKVGGMEGLVIGTLTDGVDAASGQRLFDVKCELIAVAGGATAAVSNERLSLSIAALTYTGKSFELRRWSGATLDNVGLRADADAKAFLASDYNPAGGLGPADILPNQCYPLDDPQCPFRLDVLVDGTPRPRTAVGGERYVTLDRGERFKLRVENNCNEDVYLALFVDGLNVLGKKRESASNCRYWQVDRSSKVGFGGWYSGSDKQYAEEAFEVTSASASEAGRQGFTETLGIITAVFYTIGIPPQTPLPTTSRNGLPLRKRTITNPRNGAPEEIYETRSLDRKTGKWAWNRAYLSVMPGGGIGIGSGESRSVQLEQFSGASPGLILAAISLRYATGSQLNDLRRSEGRD